MGFYVKAKSASSWTQVAEPAHQGVTVTEEPIWSSNTGRAQNGTMSGDIVAWKTTVDVKWPPLSWAESQALRNAIKTAAQSNPFFDIKYNDFSTTEVSLTVYCSNLPRTLYSIAQGHRLHQDISVTFIEQ